MNALLKIRQQGFAVSLLGDNFTVTPASQLSPNQRDFIRLHKAEISQALRQEQAANDGQTLETIQPDDDRHYCHQCAKLINGRCMASPTRYHPVDTHPRRYADYSA